MQQKCPNCSRPVQRTDPRAIYCSRLCQRAALARRHSAAKPVAERRRYWRESQQRHRAALKED